MCELCGGLIIAASCVSSNLKYYSQESILSKNYDIGEFRFNRREMELFLKANRHTLDMCGSIRSIKDAAGDFLVTTIVNDGTIETIKNGNIIKSNIACSVF